jgi:hypothetical protein
MSKIKKNLFNNKLPFHRCNLIDCGTEQEIVELELLLVKPFFNLGKLIMNLFSTNIYYISII